MNARRSWLAAAAWAGFLGVGLGAFGAHGLEGRASAEQLEWWRTASLYHLLHVAPLLALGLWERPPAPARIGGLLLLAGMVVFSGTLYAMGLGGPRWLGAVTPLGGLSLMAGWLALALAAGRPAQAPGSSQAGRASREQ